MITTNDSTLFDSVGEATAVAIDALANLHNNLCCITRKYAIRAATERREAFWSTSQYHDQKARNFLDEANDVGVFAALQARVNRNGTKDTDNPHRLINTLIPLNPQAREGIEAARRGIANEFANVRSF